MCPRLTVSFTFNLKVVGKCHHIFSSKKSFPSILRQIQHQIMCSSLTTSTARATVKADVLSPGVLMAARELPALSCLGFCYFDSVWRDDVQDPQEGVDSLLTPYMELFYEAIKARANHCLLCFLALHGSSCIFLLFFKCTETLCV